MKTLDLKKYGIRKASFFLALEEYLLENSLEEIFFLWNLEEGIVVGKNQLLETEVNLSYTKEENLAIYRRPSGGGAIYTDEGNFMFTFITRKENKEEIFHSYLSKIIEALEKLGLKTYFSGRNDLMYDRKKFSGNAFYKTRYGSVLHGTFLYNASLERMVKALTPNNEKLISKGIKSVKERVVNLKDYLPLSKEELMDFLINNISNEKYEEEIDFEKIKNIEEKFLDFKWIYGLNLPYTFQNEKRYDAGLIRAYLEIRKNKIKNLSLKGDFFEIKDVKEFCDKIIGINYNEESVSSFLKKINIDDYILNMKNEEFISLIFDVKG